MKANGHEGWSPRLLFRGMPPVLIGLFFLFLAVPLFSLTIDSSPFPAVSSAGWGSALVWALAFWFFPLAIAYSLVRAHHWFLPLYLLQCAGFIILGFAEGPASQAWAVAQGMLVVTMLYLGLLFGNKNLLYPFLMKSPRLWRRSVRFEIGRRVALSGEKGDWKAHGLLLDASFSGIAVTVPLEDFRSVLKDFVRGAPFLLTLAADARTGLPEFQLPVELVWKAETKQGEGKLGCRALNASLMKQYLKAESTKRVAQIPYHELSDDFVLEQDIQKIALVLWVVCISITLSLPRG